MWKKYCGICSLVLAVCLLVSVSVVCAQDVTVKMTKEEAAQFRVQKLNTEAQGIMAELRKKSPTEFARLDAIQAEVNKIVEEYNKTQPAPAKVEKKK
jgi:hypothetical protein